MKAEHGFDLPRGLQIEFSSAVQAVTEASGTEIAAGDLWMQFEQHYLEPGAVELRTYEASVGDAGTQLTAQVLVDGGARTIVGRGNGPVAAFLQGLEELLGGPVDVLDYHEHALGEGRSARAAAYVHVRLPDARSCWGVGLDDDILGASLRAVLSATNAGTRDRALMLPVVRTEP